MHTIRPEEPGDLAAIREVHRRAFGQELEGRIVDALRANGGAVLSLVASLRGAIVGHIMYSPVDIGGIRGAALGPMAVTPDVQRQGIGSGLVEAGTDRLVQLGYPLIVVVGHPAFYPRFGFRPARDYRITCQWDVPDEAFLVRPLDAVRLAQAVGTAVYRPEFSIAE